MMAADAERLRYFIHDDFDAFRMEISGSLVGSAARAAYEGWRVARLLARQARLIVDISHVTRADEYGEAILQAWQEQQVQIVASSPVSLAIANSIPRSPAHLLSTPRAFAGRLAFLLRRRTAGNPANAESRRIFSAQSEEQNVENTGFRLLSDMEPQVR